MKAWLVASLLVILPYCAHAGSVAWAQTLSPQRVESQADAATPDSVAPEDDRQPRLVVEQQEFDFGRAETDSSGSHDFRLTNAGNSLLVLSQGKSSCGCCTCVCESQLPDRGKIPPGASATVTLKWTIKRFTGAYAQTSTILTNDPNQPELTLRVSGRLVPAVRVVPGQLVFNGALVGQPATGEVRVYGYRAEPLRIIDWRMSDPSTSQYFETAIVPLPADQVAEEVDATSGFAIQVIVKPGLPLGPFQQQIILNAGGSSSSTIVVPIQGTIVGPVSVVGPGWDSRAGLLKLPPVTGSEEIHRTLMLVARGTYCKEAKFRVMRVVPDWIETELGETAVVNDGTLSRTPLTIRIRAGSSPANRADPSQQEAARIVIGTNHPQQPQLLIPLKFATDG